LVSTSLGDSGCDRPDAASAIEAYVAVLLDAVTPEAEVESKAEIESIAEDSVSGAKRKERFVGDSGNGKSFDGCGKSFCCGEFSGGESLWCGEVA
jgi:hypothetical protein